MAKELERLSTTFSCNDEMSKALATISGNVVGLMGDFESLQREMLSLSKIDVMGNAPKSFGLAKKMQDGFIATSGLLADKIGISTTAQNLFTKAVTGTNGAVKGLLLSIAPLAVVAGALHATVASVDKIDAYTGLQARLKLITGDMAKVKELNGEIYSSAQRARGSYTDMADNVSRLGLLAGHAFNNTDEIVTFVEQLSKQFKVAGAEIQESSSAMYQLSQAMASGRLQGDEFISIMENAPLLAQAIAKEMNVPIGKMRELSSAGLITSDVIKRALISPQAMAELNAQFESIPIKFEDVTTGLANIAQTSFSSIYERIGAVFEGGGAEKIYNVFGSGIVITAQLVNVALDGFVLFGQGVEWAGEVLESFYSVLSGVLGCYPLIIGGASAYAGWLAVVNAETIGLNIATGLNNGYMIVKNGLMVASNAIMSIYNAKLTALSVRTALVTAKQWLLNIAMSANPIGLLVGATLGLIGVFSGLALRTVSLREVMAGAWTCIAKVAGGTINFIIDRLNELIKLINAGGEMFGGIFGFKYKEIRAVGKIDTDGVAKWGANIARNFKLSDITDTFKLSPQNIDGLGDITTATQAIQENTGSIKDTIDDNFASIDELRQLALADGGSNLTNQDIKIEIINNNNINSDVDIDGIGDSIANELFRAVKANKEGVY